MTSKHSHTLTLQKEGYVEKTAQVSQIESIYNLPPQQNPTAPTDLGPLPFRTFMRVMVSSTESTWNMFLQYLKITPLDLHAS